MQESLARLDVPSIVGGLWEAALFGYACAEVLWEKRGSHVLPRTVVTKPQEWFTFDSEGALLFMAMGSANGIPVPPRKFLLARQDATLKNPYGIADLARCFWPHTFKRGGFQFWLKFVEKYGAPKLWASSTAIRPRRSRKTFSPCWKPASRTRSWSYPTTTVLRCWGRTALAFPGAAENYQAFLRFCRSEISIALLGQDQTTEADSNRASATAGLEVTGDIRDADAVMVQKAVQELVGWIVALNVGAGGGRAGICAVRAGGRGGRGGSGHAEGRAGTGLWRNCGHIIPTTIWKRPTTCRPARCGRRGNRSRKSRNLIRRRKRKARPSPSLTRRLRKPCGYRPRWTRFPSIFPPRSKPCLPRFWIVLAQSGDYSEKGLAEAIAAEYPKMNLEDLADMLARARFVCRLWGYVNA